MRAIVFDRYGSPDVLRLAEVPKPSPGPGEVLVRVRAASVSDGDWHLVRGEPVLVRLMSGLLRPKLRTPGSDVAGTVEAVGAGVARFRPGDEVFGDLSSSGFGGFAEYACASEAAWSAKPPNVGMEEAAAAPGSTLAAMQAIRAHGQIGPGLRVLITGASGGVGSMAVQLARDAGAEVTALGSRAKIEFLRSLGADHVVDRAGEDITLGGGRYDLILDAGAYRSVLAYRRILADGGTYVMIGGSFRIFLQAVILGPLLSRKGRRRMTAILASPNAQDLETIRRLLESGRLRPAIDRRFELGEAASALRHVEEGQAMGKVVLRVDGAD